MRSWLPARRDPAADELGSRLADLEERIRDVEQADQAGQRSIDDDSLDFYDDEDVLRARIGKQPDGSFTTKAYGRKPQTPTEPDVLPVSGGCVVEWDGSFEDAQPEDVQRVAIHVGLTADFAIVTGEDDDENSDEDSTERAAILSPRGGSAFLSLDPGEEKFWIRLTAVAEGGAESDPSPAVEVVPETAEAVFHQDEFLLTVAGAQDLKLTYEPLDNSDHLYWNGLYQREDVAWDRIRKTVTLSGAPYPAKAGDLVTVEYAYLPGQQPEEITYYRGTPEAAWYRGTPSLNGSWTCTWYIRFEEPVLTLYYDPLLYTGTGSNLSDYSLKVDWWLRDANGVLYVDTASYTNRGIPYTGWGPGQGNAGGVEEDPHIYRSWGLYHSLGNQQGGIVDEHPHNLVGCQISPYGGEDNVLGRAALGLNGGEAVPPGTMLTERGFFWMGEQLPGMPTRWGPLGTPTPES